MSKKIYTIVEEWDNCADYKEDEYSSSKVLVSTNSIKLAKQIIRKRKELTMSYLDTKYLDNEDDEIRYEYDAEWFISCRIVTDICGFEHTYCGDAYFWRIIENYLIDDES